MSAHPQSALEHASMTAGKPVILIVDDSRVMRLSLKKMLKTDFEVIEAKDGEDGWNKLHGNPSIVAIFSDLSMPVLDGFGLLDRVRNASAESISSIPFIVLTGNEDGDGIKEKALDAGATDFITKPFRSSEIMDRANRYVLQTGAADTVPQEAVVADRVDALPVQADKSAATDSLEQELAQRHAQEQAAQRFAEQEAARMRELMLEQKRAEDEAKARQRAETLARHEEELRRRQEEDKMHREAEFARRAEGIAAPEPLENIPAPAIEVDLDYIELQLEGSGATADRAQDSKFSSWTQDSTYQSNRDEARVAQDNTLQLELDEALNEAIQTSPATDKVAFELELESSVDVIPVPEQGRERSPAFQRGADAVLHDSTQVEEIHASGGVSARQATIIPPMEAAQRLSETEQIRQTLSVMRHQEQIDELPGYSLSMSVLVHCTLPFYKLLNRLLRLGKQGRIEEIETRLYK